MSTVVHVLRVEQTAEPRLHGSFPDLPGPAVSARTLPVLASRAREALLFELQRLQSAGLDWPEPAAITALRTPAGDDRPLMLMIEVQVDDTPVRINVSIGERLLKRLDAAASAKDMSRSGFIAAAVRDRLGDERIAGAQDPILQRLTEEIGRVGGLATDALGPGSDLRRLVSGLDKSAENGWRTLTSLISTQKSRDG